MYKNVRLKFDLEFRPTTFDDETEYYIDIQLTTKNLESLINELSSETLKYPIRR